MNDVPPQPVAPAAAAGPANPAPREVEWQFDAPDLDVVARWIAERGMLATEPRDTVDLIDRYLDTPDWRVERAGYTLRLRAKGSVFEATLKATASEPAAPGSEGDAAAAGHTHGGTEPRRRREWNERLDGAIDDPSFLRCAPGPVGTRVAALAGDLPLRELFTIRTLRRRFHLRDADGHFVGEVALDRTTASAADRCSEPLLRVEIEAAHAAAEPLLAHYAAAMRAACELAPASRTKFETGLAIAALRPPDSAMAPRAATGGGVHGSMRIADLAHAVLRSQLAALRAAEPGTRLGDDAEPLHDMRVAARRMRSAVRAFPRVIDPALLPLEEELRWLNEVLSPLRDLDVQRAQFESWGGPGGRMDPVLTARLAPRHEAARARMLRTLDSPRYAALIANATAALLRPAPPTGAARAPVLRAAPAAMRTQWRRVARGAGRLDAAASADVAYHAVRKRAKQARYTAEFVAGLYGKPARRLAAALTEIQDLLGEHQDAVVGVAEIDALLADDGARLAPETVAAALEAQDALRATIAERRARFPAAFARTRRRWKRLAQRMRHARRAT